MGCQSNLEAQIVGLAGEVNRLENVQISNDTWTMRFLAIGCVCAALFYPIAVRPIRKWLWK